MHTQKNTVPNNIHTDFIRNSAFLLMYRNYFGNVAKNGGVDIWGDEIVVMY